MRKIGLFLLMVAMGMVTNAHAAAVGSANPVCTANGHTLTYYCPASVSGTKTQLSYSAISFGDTITVPALDSFGTACPTPNNKKFVGWEYNGKTYAAGASFVLKADADVDMVALFADNDSASISYNTNGGVINDTSYSLTCTTTSTSIVLPTSVNRLGYQFTGWYDENGEKVTEIDKAICTKDAKIALNAGWTPNLINVHFNPNGALGTLSTDKITYNYDGSWTPVAQGELKKANHVFVGWSIDKDATVAKYKVGQTYQENLVDSGTATLYAVWSECAAAVAGTGVQSATLSGVVDNVCQYVHVCASGYYNANHNQTTTQSSINCSPCTGLPSNAAWTGASTTNTCPWDCNACVLGDNAASCNVTKGTNSCTYTGTCNTNAFNPTANGTTVSCSACPAGSYSVSGNSAESCNCTIGHSVGGTPDGATTTDGAVCTPITYPITYHLNGGTNYTGAPTSYTINDLLIIDGMPTRDGYVFDGWCTDEGLTQCAYSQSAGIAATGNRTYWAKWIKAECSATNSTATLAGLSGNQVTCSIDCNTGYSQSGGVDTTDKFEVTGNLGVADVSGTCSARTFSVSFDANGGTGGQSANVTATYDASMPTISTTAPTRTGYKFAGWYSEKSGGVQYYTSSGASARTWNIAKDTTLYAHWTAGDMNTITFNSNGGVINDASYETECNVESPDIILPTDVTRAGYTFNGWYDANNTQVTTIPAGTCTASMSFTAKWTVNSYKCESGEYLAAGATVCATCPAKSYCGGSTYTYNTDKDQGKTSCPSDYPNSANGAKAITECYSNTKQRTWSGKQVNGATPTNCASVTAWNSCSIDACDYVAYSNASGSGDGTVKSGCATNNADCTKTVKSVTANANSYVDGATCKVCPSDYPKSDGGDITSDACYIVRTNTGSEVAPSLPTGCTSQTVNSCEKPTCEYKDYAGQSGESCTPGTCNQTHKSCTSAKTNYYLDSGVAKSCPSDYPSSAGGNVTSDACYGTFSKSGVQKNGSVPANCASVTEWTACTPGTCEYTKYQSGAIKTDCTPSDCTKTVKAVTANANSYVDGTTCKVCPTSYPSSAGGDISDAYCYTTCGSKTGYTLSSGYDYKGTTDTCAYAANKYTVTYSCGVGSGTAPSAGTATYDANFTPASNTCTAPAGYKFSTWTDGTTNRAASTAFKWQYTEDKTFTAQWVAGDVNTITYNTNGGVINDASYETECNVESGTITLATDVTRAGYTFNGWYDANDTLVTTIPTGTCTASMTFTAKWTKCGACTTGASVDSCSVTVSNNTCVANATCKPGYKNPTCNGLQCVCFPHEYKVAYNKNASSATGSMSDQSFVYGTAQNLTANGFTNPGLNFQGWATSSGGAVAYSDGQLVSNLTTEDNGVFTLYAVWGNATTYTITYELNGGTNNASNPATYTVEDSVTFATPSKTGYTFDGWYKESTFNTKTTGISAGTTGNQTVYAKWVANTFLVTFDTNGATGGTPGQTSITCTYNQECTTTTQNTLVKTNNVFVGWNTKTDGSGTSYAAGTSIKNISTGTDTALYAVWSECAAAVAGTGVKSATLSGVVDNVCQYVHVCDTGYYNATHNQATTQSSINCTPCTGLPSNAAWTGASTTNTCEWDCNACVLGDNAASCSVTKGTNSCTYTGTCNTNTFNPTANGTTVSCSACPSYSVANNNAMSCTCYPGYSVGGTPDGTKTTDGAACTPITYPITYHLNGGTNCASTSSYTFTMYAGGAVQGVYCTPTRDDYVFNGWCTDEDLTSCAYRYMFNPGEMGEKTYWAKWTQATCSATNGKSTLDNISIHAIGGNQVTCSIDCNTGYSQSGGTDTTDKFEVTGNLGVADVSGTCSARTFSVSFDANGGTGGQSANVTATYDASMPTISTTAPTRTGYKFAGWYSEKSGGVQYYTSSGASARTWNIAKDTTLYAHWTAGDMNTITFNSNGGASVDSIECNVESGTITLPTDVTRAGYTFNGWHDANDTLVATIPTGTCLTAMTFTAKWTPNVYAITLDVNGGTTESKPNVIYVKHGVKEFWLDPECTKEIGWSVTEPARKYTVTLDGNGGQVYSVVGSTEKFDATTINIRLYFEDYWSEKTDGVQYTTWAYYGLLEPTDAAYAHAPLYTEDHTWYAHWREKDARIYLWHVTAPYGYTFTGWYDAPVGGNYIGKGGDEYYATQDITFYAQYELSEIYCYAGEYLPKGSTRKEYCPAGHYCQHSPDGMKGASYTYNTEKDQGISGVCKSGWYDGKGIFGTACCLDGVGYSGNWRASGPGCRSCNEDKKAPGYEATGDKATDHDQESDCTKTITLVKEADTGTERTTITCAKGLECNFGRVSGTAKNGLPFTGGWGTSSTCSSTTTKFVTPTADTYYACSACSGGYEMVNGVCQPCDRENATAYKPGESCQVAKCHTGYHPDADKCVSDIKTCSLPNAIDATQTWDSALGTYSTCKVTECADGYHVASNACVPNIEKCDIEHGTGTREWNELRNAWDECIATSCDAGYTNDPYESDEPTKQCGRCRNATGIMGEEAVSSYARGCEIATCMYQGELYNLENNECVPICPIDAYSDDTGTMKWNPKTKKCERECFDGYMSW